MRVIVVAPMAYLPHLMQILNKNVQVAVIVVMDLQFGKGIIPINGQNYNICSYDYLKESVTEFYYDYILTTIHLNGTVLEDLKKFQIPKEKIFELNAIYDNGWSHLFVHFFHHMVSHISKYKIFITGISYGYTGTNISSYELPILRCASSSQDLYYDYQFAKKLLNMKDSNFKYAIIELAPYIFHYDISIGTIQQWLMLSYYFGFRDVHNYHISCKEIEDIFDTKFLTTNNLPVPEGFDERDFIPSMTPQFTIDKRMKAREEAEAWKNKRYPKTVKENKKIFNDYISLCKQYNVWPIVVRFPAIDAYREFFPKQLIDEYNYILAESGIGERFSFIDKWNFDDKLTYQDFFDSTHLNSSGAKKMSSFLNDYIMNLESQGGGYDYFLNFLNFLIFLLSIYKSVVISKILYRR